MDWSKHVIGLLLAVSLVYGCGTPAKLRRIQRKEMAATLALSRNELEEERKIIQVARRDTLKVKDDAGNEVLIMKAVRDSSSGEMVATDIIDAAVITARFRNVAERHGRIDLRFEVIVPAAMQDSRWQLRFMPDMFILGDSIRLEPVLITGRDFRRAQLRGYEQYNRFLRSIITDSSRFVDLRNLEIFIQRNLPELYRFKEDSSYVSDEAFHSLFGVTGQQALDHYTNYFSIRLNERRKARRPQMYAKYVKVPIEESGIRLDTVIQELNGDFVYHYTQTVLTRPKLRKIDIILSGEIYEGDTRLYTMARTEPLTFYVSSLSAFVDDHERYLTKIIERKAAANTACYVDFATGKALVDPTLGNNLQELSRIKGNILELLENRTFDLDSIVIAASASPEGELKANLLLSKKRASAVADFFDAFIRHYRDSVRRNSFSVTVQEDGQESRMMAASAPGIPFRSRSNGENWSMLSFLVDEDTVLTRQQVQNYLKVLEIQNLDQRETALQKESFYPYLREKLYPRLRTVKFDFFLHRKGMVKDSVHTTEPDTVYRKGLEALKERDYRLALEYLREYRDYNTAIAYVSLDYNASAMAILQELPRTPQVNYMLALLYARAEDDQKAVQCYLDACREDHSYVFRGNLDPEIYVLIQRYALNKEDEDLSSY